MSKSTFKPGVNANNNMNPNNNMRMSAQNPRMGMLNKSVMMNPGGMKNNIKLSNFLSTDIFGDNDDDNDGSGLFTRPNNNNRPFGMSLMTHGLGNNNLAMQQGFSNNQP